MAVRHAGQHRRARAAQAGHLGVHRRVQLGGGADGGYGAGALVDEHGAVGGHPVRGACDDTDGGDQ
ncbi:hypothetical protein OH809_38355 [Streptomyces sp. NBC_00873]|uniref:hypothetical protein n=1 Tax=unclassified Streptomyces TaxID=2593676 RepID=UPI003863C6AE|nr:hypothetical protein OH809_38355 [Streptomyces sp. NBC_00873]WTA42113.1 hypothetical protein OH821_05355 [Streptomyces sp. NBC_00842]